MKLGWLLIAVTVLIGGCKSTPRSAIDKSSGSASLVIGQIHIQNHLPTTRKVPELNESLILEWIKNELRSSHEVLRFDSSGKDGYRLNVTLNVGVRENANETEKASIHALAVVEARLLKLKSRIMEKGGIELQASAATPILSMDNGVDRTIIKKLIAQTIGDLISQAILATGSPAQLVEALQVKGKSQKVMEHLAVALEIVAARRLRETVPAVVQLLKYPDQKIADQAIGTLVEIGDQRAVKALTRLAEFRDTARLAKIIDAIGALGGQEALDYLDFVASGHEDADIRSLASEALQRLKRRLEKNKRAHQVSSEK